MKKNLPILLILLPLWLAAQQKGTITPVLAIAAGETRALGIGSSYYKGSLISYLHIAQFQGRITKLRKL